MELLLSSHRIILRQISNKIIEIVLPLHVIHDLFIFKTFDFEILLVTEHEILLRHHTLEIYFVYLLGGVVDGRFRLFLLSAAF
jgi:hypothetical protein